MKKLLMALLALMMLAMPLAALADTTAAETAQPKATDATARDYAPQPGEGWLVCTIDGAPVEFTYTDSVKSMADTTHSFTAEKYTLNIVFNKKLEVGVTLTPNAMKSIEVVSSNDASAGYYAVKKSTASDVESEVTLEIDENGIMQGKFSAVVRPADRWVGDLRPGILEALPLTEGEFCFCQPE